MTRTKLKNKKPNSSFVRIEIVVAIIGVIGTIATAVFGYLGARSQIEIPMRATQTAESSLISTPSTTPTLQTNATDERSTRGMPTVTEIPSSSRLSFDNITIESTNPTWREALPNELKYFYDFGEESIKYFVSSNPVVVATPSLDITVINRTDSPILLTNVGIQLVSFINTARVNRSGPPRSEKVEVAGAYSIQMPAIFSESIGQLEKPISTESIISTQLPDPIYMEAQAPFRFILVLDPYNTNVKKATSDAVFRLWVKTSMGEDTSAIVQLLIR